MNTWKRIKAALSKDEYTYGYWKFTFKSDYCFPIMPALPPISCTDEKIKMVRGQDAPPYYLCMKTVLSNIGTCTTQKIKIWSTVSWWNKTGEEVRRKKGK